MTRGKPLSFDRSKVLEKAMELFWANGYEATGITELLECMGIQRQSFYNSFESKQQVFAEALDLYGSTMLMKVRELLAGSGNPIKKIERVFKFWEGMMKDHAGCGCLVANSVAEFGTSEKMISEVLRSNLGRLEETLYGAFKEAVDGGSLPAERDPRALARTMVAFAQGMALLSKTGMSQQAQRDVMKTTQRALLS